MAEHTTYRVYCRHNPSCGNWPRLNRKQARTTAEDHAEQRGHVTEYARLTFDVIGTIQPPTEAVTA